MVEVESIAVGIDSFKKVLLWSDLTTDV